MNVPLLDARRQNLPLEAELTEAFRRVLHSGRFIGGPEVERFEQQAAALAGARFGIGMSSGTDAILVALMALGIGPGDEVICPSFTFFATGGCIARLGARPVFADSLADSFNIDPAEIEPLITSRTRAIIPVHLYGQAADMEAILESARRHSLAVIEDAAQSLGAEYRGQPVGSFGAFGTVSFYPTKNLGALGDAGLLVTNDAALAEKARLLRDHGAHAKYFHSVVGGNFRLDALQAAFLAVKLPHLSEYTAARRNNAREYTGALERLPGREAVEVMLPGFLPDRTHIVNQYTLRVRRGKQWRWTESPRDALGRWLRERGIGCEVYYPVPLHRQECFGGPGPQRALPVAEALAEEAISVPVFPELTTEERTAVTDAIADFVFSSALLTPDDRIAPTAAERG
ncbi:MAG TPA: DegT/DnrJ/EryC1/StrS family aminotransferase [Candidatus Sulfopaludibacter sp.]|nr:DegT/DnrJ/EryC1/StrS family aminotransferase [Candidatus Sulfopaludibacter sp.]